MFIGLCKSLYLVGSAVCIDEKLLPFRGRCGFWQYMPKNPSKCRIKIWMRCDFATKYMMNAKVYLGKENN
jgi:ribosome-associated toxin RatA of RatAB toxin-antitoxin module